MSMEAMVSNLGGFRKVDFDEIYNRPLALFQEYCGQEGVEPGNRKN